MTPGCLCYLKKLCSSTSTVVDFTNKVFYTSKIGIHFFSSQNYKKKVNKGGGEGGV